MPAGLLEDKKLVRIAPDGMILFTLDFANSEFPVMLFRLVPQATAL